MKNLFFYIKMSFPYRYLRMIIYYLFQKHKRDKIIEKRKLGIDNKYQYLRKYKNIHLGERCFIVATGPSLSQSQLNMIKNEKTIGVNALCMKFKEMDWHTTYFVISDLAAYTKLSPILNESNIEFFSAYKSNDVNENIVYLPTDIHNSYMVNYSKKEFVNDIELGCGNGNTVVLHAIQLAVYMGFKKIYLVGVDCNYKPNNGKLYFIDHNIRGREQQSAGNRMIADFESIKRYERYWGIKIYNASNGGMLETFPRCNLSDIIQGNK